MAKDLFLGNKLPGPLTPVATGNEQADEAIRKLQRWVVPTTVPAPPPTGKDYDATVKAALKAGPVQLLALLDDAALELGTTRWNDAAQARLTTAERREFKKHYDAVLQAMAIRSAYLRWLMSAVVTTPQGLERVIEIATTNDTGALGIAATVLQKEVKDPKALRRFADASQLAKWDGKEDERAHRVPIAVLNTLDPNAAFARYAPFLDAAALKKPGGAERAACVLFGLLQSPADPRWLPILLPHLKKGPLDNNVLMLLEKLPPDPRVVEPVCAYLPKPTNTGGYWNQTAVKVLAKSADARALPWLVGALQTSWMNWPAVFEAFARVGDPSMAHVMRAWLKDNDAPDRQKAAKPILAALEKKGPAPQPTIAVPGKKAPPPRVRPALKFKKARPFKAPKLEPLEKLRKTYAKLFADAGLGAFADTLSRPAVVMIPTRVDEQTLEFGTTKLGGHPDLEAKTEWPRVKGEPLTFLGQLALADFAPLLPPKSLPAAGLLSFFVGNDGASERAGYCENARVLFTRPGATLARRDVPDDFFDVIYQACAVKLHPTLKLPSPSHALVTKTLNARQRETYADEVFVEARALPQVLGFRDHGYDAEEPLTARHLLQLPGEDQSDMEFGDMDALSFCVDAKQLAKGDFSKVWPRLGD